MAAKIQMEKISAGDYRGQAVITYLFEDSKSLTSDQTSIDRRYHGIISAVLKSNQFKGERYELCPLTVSSSKGLRRIVLVGLGKSEDFRLDFLRNAASLAVQSLLAAGIDQIASTILNPEDKKYSLQDQAQVITEGGMLGAYQFDPYRSEKKDRPAALAEFLLLARDLPPGPIRDGINWGRSSAQGTNYARTLGNHPPNVATPEFLAREAQEMAKHYPSLRCRVLERADVEKLGMGAFLSVNQGSAQNRPLKLIVLEYRGRKSQRGGRSGHGRHGRLPRIGLIGKGITFDTGGISLKPSKDLHEMKYDMSGAAAVLGIMRALAELNLPVEIIGMIPTTENMPGGNASRPGDVVKSLSGKTIEILNTDAEGRLILCDTLTYLQKENVEAILDFATLTGACVVALGGEASGLFSNNDQLAAQVEQAGQLSGERVWRLPLWGEYHEMLKSDIADMKNIGGSGAGAITAACFLEKFIENKLPWAHLDIAGTAWLTERKPGRASGATGVGVRLTLEFLKRYKALK